MLGLVVLSPTLTQFESGACVHRHAESPGSGNCCQQCASQHVACCQVVQESRLSVDISEAETHEVSCCPCALDGVLVCLQNTSPFLCGPSECHCRLLQEEAKHTAW